MLEIIADSLLIAIGVTPERRVERQSGAEERQHDLREERRLREARMNGVRWR